MQIAGYALCISDFFRMSNKKRYSSIKICFCYISGANLLAVNGDGNMPYDICEEERTLDAIESEMAARGVTQRLIDETRAATEMAMFRDIADMVQGGMDLDEPRDSQGATLVSCVTPL